MKRLQEPPGEAQQLVVVWSGREEGEPVNAAQVGTAQHATAQHVCALHPATCPGASWQRGRWRNARWAPGTRRRAWASTGALSGAGRAAPRVGNSGPKGGAFSCFLFCHPPTHPSIRVGAQQSPGPSAQLYHLVPGSCLSAPCLSYFFNSCSMVLLLPSWAALSYRPRLGPPAACRRRCLTARGGCCWPGGPAPWRQLPGSWPCSSAGHRSPLCWGGGCRGEARGRTPSACCCVL